MIKLTFEADGVKIRVSKKDFSGVLVVKQSKPHYRESSEYNVVALVDPLLVEGLSAESRKEPKPELGQYEQYILVEDVADKVRISPVGLSTVHKDQIF